MSEIRRPYPQRVTHRLSATTTSRLRVRTRRVSTSAELLELLPAAAGVTSWVQDGAGLVGWGEAVRFEPSGPGRFAAADQWWREFVDGLDVADDVRLPGTGPVCFVSIAFADEPGRSTMIVPKVVVGRRDGLTWITECTVGEPEAAPADARPRNGHHPDGAGTNGGRNGHVRNGTNGHVNGAVRGTPIGLPDGFGTASPVRAPQRLRYAEGQLSAIGYREAVEQAVKRMRTGEFDKIVLAHDRVATADEPIDARFLLQGLAERYPTCWTFAVDGLVGATPELLLRRDGDVVDSRVLAGTMWPTDGVTEDELAARLLHSHKNQVEHRYAARSLADTLRPYCDELSMPDEAEVIRLRNVLHLATTVTGRLHHGNGAPTSLLELAAAVHPTAAVGGTPTATAVPVIAELEGMERGRYAGPVGWVDAAGNGELGIALRCAQLDGRSIRMFAGCGIVADSDPDNEVLEAAAKFLPIRDALETSAD